MGPTFLESIFVTISVTIFITLFIDNAYIRFKIERFFRKIFRRPLISAELNTRQVSCKNGFLLLHGISIKNRMWFTHKIPNVFCNAPLTLNFRGICDYFGDFNLKMFKPFKVDELHDKYVECMLKATSDPNKRRMDLFRETRITVEFISEFLEINNEKPLNTIKKVGDLHISSRNLLPILSPGYKKPICINSSDYGRIGWIYVEIPENLYDLDPISDRDQYAKMANPPILLSDIGIPNLRWPLRFKIIKVKS
jgi:hypothetical protein